MYGKVPRYNETSRRYREQILPFSWYFVISRFHCNEFFPLHPNLPTFFPLICKVILFCSLIYIFLNQNRSLHNLKNAKIVWNWRLQIILCGVLEGLEHRNAINTVTDPGEGSGGQPPPPPPLFFRPNWDPKGRKNFFEPGHPLPTYLRVLMTGPRLTFYENLLTGQETSDRCPRYWVSVFTGLNLQKM